MYLYRAKFRIGGDGSSYDITIRVRVVAANRQAAIDAGRAAVQAAGHTAGDLLALRNLGPAPVSQWWRASVQLGLFELDKGAT